MRLTRVPPPPSDKHLPKPPTLRRGSYPLTAGNIRTRSLADAYRNDPVFRDLRNPDLLTGRCGCCEYRSICGGSRSRAFAMTGDILASDPWCAYEPRGGAVSERLNV